MIFAIPYMRYSSKAQKIGNSEQRQEDGFADFLKSSGLSPWKESYKDLGESGYHGNHRQGAFGRLLADCAAKLFPVGSVVWIENMDRFSREELDLVLPAMKTITNNGYKIQIGQGQTIEKGQSQFQMVAPIVGSILAHEESEKKSVRAKANRETIRTTGYTKHGRKQSVCPFWIELKKGGKEYQLRDEVAAELKLACLMAIQGHGAMSIAKSKVGQKLLSFTRVTKTGKVVPCLETLRSLPRIFGSTHLKGIRQHGKIIGKNKVEKIGTVETIPELLTEQEWDNLQAAIQSRKYAKASKKTFIWLFSGLLEDSQGGKMIGGTNQGKKKWYVQKERRTIGKQYHQIDNNFLETCLLSCFVEISKEELFPLAGSPMEALQALVSKRATLESKVDKLNARFVEAPEDETDYIMTSIIALKKAMQELTTEIEGMKREENLSKNDYLGDCQDMLDAIKTLSGDELKEARTRLQGKIRMLVESVKVSVKGSQSASFEVSLKGGKVMQGDGFGWKGLTVAMRETA